MFRKKGRLQRSAKVTVAGVKPQERAPSSKAHGLPKFSPPSVMVMPLRNVARRTHKNRIRCSRLECLGFHFDLIAAGRNHLKCELAASVATGFGNR